MSAAEKAGDPIDLDELAKAMVEGGDFVVSPAWAKRVHAELTAGREAARVLGRVFGLQPGQTL